MAEVRRKRGGQFNKPTRKALVYGYLDQEEKIPLKNFLSMHKMQKRTFFVLEGEYKAEKVNLTKIEKLEKKDRLKAMVLDAWDRVEGREPPKRTVKGHEITDISEDEKVALARKIYIDAMAGRASARDKDLAVRMLGMLIEKHEVKVGLTADEFARQHLENQRWLREHGYLEEAGVQQVQSEPPLLSE